MTSPERPSPPITPEDPITPENIAALSPAELATQLNRHSALVGGGTLGTRLGIVLISASRERVVASMPVAGNLQPAGRLHGGASAALIEELASIGSWLNLDMGKQTAVGVDLNVTHVRGSSAGEVRGVAELLYRGRTVLVWSVSITNDQGKVTSTGRCTCNVVGGP
jgi:1,4-dihydroxy-2-naphthoyl-CoA hydrolase